jgi:xanthine dehydrogenase YagS FAD-binding subunit
MRPFAYVKAQDLDDAVANVRAAPGARFLGGGTNLVDLMRLEVETPDLLVDVTKLALHNIEETPAGGLRIGAAVTNSELAADPLVRERYPMLALALLNGASGQLRNLATVGGNLLQRTRCDYFQDITSACNKREPGSGCAAIDGEHRNLAIFGWSENCVATHPSDMAVALAALDARVLTHGPNGQRTVSMPGLHRFPGDEPDRDTILEHGELITGIELPSLPVARRSTYRKIRERASYAFALVSVAAAIDVVEDEIAEVRVAFGGVAHAPWRARVLEEELAGAPADADHIAAAVDAELAHARPLRDNAYKVPLARAVTIRTLLDLVAAP